MIDRRTLVAIVLSALVLIFVPMLLERAGLIPKRSPRTAQQQTVPGDTESSGSSTAGSIEGSGAAGGTGSRAESAFEPGSDDTSSGAGSLGAAGGSSAVGGVPNPFPTLTAAPDREVTVRTEKYEAHLSSRGATLSGVELFAYHSREDGNVRLAGSPTVRIDLGGAGAPSLLANAPFDVAESTDASGAVRKVRFTAADTLGLRLSQTYEFNPETNVIDLAIEVQGAIQRGISEYRLILSTWPLVTERNVGEDVRNLQAVTKVGSDIRRDNYNDLNKKGRKTHDGTIAWTAVRSKYFAVAAVPAEANSGQAFAEASQLPALGVAEDSPWKGQQVEAGLVLPVPPEGVVHRLKLYAGPNDYWALQKAGYGLQDIVDLGWRWLLPFSRAILQVMVWLKQYIPNFGLVIIALSAMVRLIFHPLNNASMKSMRAMQRLQPEMERVRKKYEKDPQKMNQAVMELYKENKVNPLGGCLPMLVQMPVLIALYQVFLHAIDLRQAPFFLWVNDLSSPDVLLTLFGFPIRVLPLIMFVSTYLQQSLTPTDSRQKMTMLFMNLFMLVLFYNLPSGLVLYWTVTNILTAAQMYLIHRGDIRQQAKAT